MSRHHVLLAPKDASIPIDFSEERIKTLRARQWCIARLQIAKLTVEPPFFGGIDVAELCDVFVTSPRPYPEKLPPLEYPGHFPAKRVTNAGTFRLKHKLLFIANALKTHHIGLEEIDDGIWSIYLGAVLLARVDERDFVIRD